MSIKIIEKYKNLLMEKELAAGFSKRK